MNDESDRQSIDKYGIAKLINKKGFRFNYFIKKKVRPISKILFLQRELTYFMFRRKFKYHLKKSVKLRYHFYTKYIRLEAIKIKNNPTAVKRKYDVPVNVTKEGIKYRIKMDSQFITKRIICLDKINLIRNNYRKYKLRVLDYETLLSRSKKIKKSNKIFNCFTDKIYKVDKMEKLITLQRVIKYFVYRQGIRNNEIVKIANNRPQYYKKARAIYKPIKDRLLYSIIIFSQLVIYFNRFKRRAFAKRAAAKIMEAEKAKERKTIYRASKIRSGSIKRTSMFSQLNKNIKKSIRDPQELKSITQNQKISSLSSSKRSDSSMTSSINNKTKLSKAKTKKYG